MYIGKRDNLEVHFLERKCQIIKFFILLFFYYTFFLRGNFHCWVQIVTNITQTRDLLNTYKATYFRFRKNWREWPPFV